MEINIIMFVNLLAYSIMVSQAFSYVIALRNVQLQMQPATYIELRQLLDKNFQSKNRVVVYITLVSCTALTILCSMNTSGFLFISSAIALAALIIGIVLTLKGNVPINKVINTWSADNYPHNWKDYRSRWLSVFAKRQVLDIIGFLSLLAGAIFG